MSWRAPFPKKALTPMFDDALAAVRQIMTPPFRTVLYKSLALTLAILVLMGIGFDRIINAYIVAPYPWLATALAIVAGFGLVFGLAFLIAPATSLVAGFFLDELAGLVEKEIDPDGPQGRALPAGQAIFVSIRFAALSVLVNVFAVLLLLVPGINLIAFFVANAFLMGREYFELAALRFMPMDQARAMRQANMAEIFLYGLMVAGFVAIPLVNLATPLFGTALMVRVHKRLASRALARRVSKIP